MRERSQASQVYGTQDLLNNMVHYFSRGDDSTIKNKCYTSYTTNVRERPKCLHDIYSLFAINQEVKVVAALIPTEFSFNKAFITLYSSSLN